MRISDWSSDVCSSDLANTSPEMFAQGDDTARFKRLRDGVRFVRFGGDCYSYGLLASGHLDLVVDAMMQVYDSMALWPVVQGAGGAMSDWPGRPLGLARSEGSRVGTECVRTCSTRGAT